MAKLIPFYPSTEIPSEQCNQAAHEPLSKVQAEQQSVEMNLEQKVVPIKEVAQLFQSLRKGEAPWPLEDEEFHYTPESGFVFLERFL